jgi:hypothetical protein
MTTTRVDVMTKEEKERLRIELERQVRDYKSSGGVINVCPPRAFTTNDAPLRKFDSIKTHDSLTDPSARKIGSYNPKKID